MEEVADYIEEEKNKFENANQMLKLAKQITGCKESVALPGRKVLKQGIILEYVTSTKRSKYRYLFLFTDILMLTEAKKKGKQDVEYKYCDSIQLMSAKSLPLSDSLSLKNAFKVTQATSKEWILFTTSKMESDSWHKAILARTEAIRHEASEKRKTSAPTTADLAKANVALSLAPAGQRSTLPNPVISPRTPIPHHSLPAPIATAPPTTLASTPNHQSSSNNNSSISGASHVPIVPSPTGPAIGHTTVTPTSPVAMVRSAPAVPLPDRSTCFTTEDNTEPITPPLTPMKISNGNVPLRVVLEPSQLAAQLQSNQSQLQSLRPHTDSSPPSPTHRSRSELSRPPPVTIEPPLESPKQRTQSLPSLGNDGLSYPSLPSCSCNQQQNPLTTTTTPPPYHSPFRSQWLPHKESADSTADTRTNRGLQTDDDREIRGRTKTKRRALTPSQSEWFPKRNCV
eukprot:TRINITY_DN8564_c0_g1_i1.p1 TRINITY_DN8564_c0_g1~~TRINITY_DN8564_c0_g1_i1.p1  ORF type:complete len:466 (-),score=50.50 TRINITY_DN8564_c0_g1_i1:32-1396(-)